MCEDITLSGDGGRAMYVRSGYGEKIVQVSKALREPLTALAETDGVTSSSPDEHFLEVIRGETENQSTPESFLNVIRFTEACWKSGAQGGKPVTIA